MQATNFEAPFGFCECGAEAAGSYYGGAVRSCQACFDKKQEQRKIAEEEEVQVAALESAQKFSAKHNISLTEAILILKK